MPSVRFLGKFTSYTPAGEPAKALLALGVFFCRNESAQDLYKVRDALSTGTQVLVADPITSRVIGAARTPFVPIPADGQTLWAVQGDNLALDTDYLGWTIDVKASVLVPKNAVTKVVSGLVA